MELLDRDFTPKRFLRIGIALARGSLSTFPEIDNDRDRDSRTSSTASRPPTRNTTAMNRNVTTSRANKLPAKMSSRDLGPVQEWQV